jgi:hypothetical protein
MTNRYHRYLNIPSEYTPNIDFSTINTDGLDWIKFHRSIGIDGLNNPKIIKWLSSLDLTTQWVEAFYTPSHDKSIIHSDTPNWQEWAKIIFQYSAKGSTMRWWTSDTIQSVKSAYGHPFFHSHENDAKLEYEVEISQPSLLNVGPLHSSHNPTDEKRFTATIALFHFDGTRVLWDEAVEKLSSYIEE